MEPGDKSAKSNEVIQVVSAEPISEAAVSEVAEVVPGVVVARSGGEPQTAPRRPQEAGVCDLHKNGRLCEALECMLFVSTEPLSAAQLAEALQVDVSDVEQAVNALEARLDSGSGLQLMRVAGGYQLCTRPEFADYCSIILQPVRKKLSKAALETLAVIAYRQPCTQPEIEAVRGVCVDGVIKTLIDRGLIKEAGRKPTPGRPILYATTPEFLEYFGLNDISELPDIDELAVDEIKALKARKDLFEAAGASGGHAGEGTEAAAENDGRAQPEAEQ